jgi:predicted permease
MLIITGTGEPIFVEPGFKVVLIAVLILTLIFLAVALILSFIKEPTEQQKQLFTLCTHLLSIGGGGVVGLLGGKASAS